MIAARLVRDGPRLSWQERMSELNGSSTTRATATIACVVLLTAVSAWATTVLAIRGPSWIVVASDSMYVSHEDGRSSTICKIHQGKNFYWASEGVYGGAGQSFDLPSLVGRADSVKSHALLDEMSTLDDIIVPALSDYLTLLRKAKPAKYQEILDRKHAATVIFFRVEQGLASYVSDAFYIAESPNREIIISSNDRKLCPGDCPEPISKWEDGEREAVDKYFEQHGMDGTPEDFLKRMVALEISDKPTTVGPPISVLRLDEHGASWPSPGVCQ